MTEPAFNIIPIMIREDVRVDVRIPVDLTEAEAKKIGAVILALAAPQALRDHPLKGTEDE